ncbi:MAG TPA: hypothetical protein PL091_16460 [Actinomycetota bacterium]|nr:hypothetical protein [Actinomycetota bacterium]HPJ19502.1 hypothetical protein [Actinomycetota bacterium]
MDDTLHSHPKTRRAGLAAMGLWTVCGSYCMAYKTNGFVPEWFVAGFQSGRKLAADLVRAGKWEDAVKDNENGWQFHDWLDYQQSAEEIERDRDHNRNRQREFRRKLREGKKKESE